MLLMICRFLSGSDAALERRRRSLELLVTDTHDPRWEREFRVFFDASRPIGLGFGPDAPKKRSFSSASSPTARTRRPSLVVEDEPQPGAETNPNCGYECLVLEVMGFGHAKVHNDRCVAAGDYSR